MSEDGSTIVIDLWDDGPGLAIREIYQRFRVAGPALIRVTDRESSSVTAALMVRFVATDLAPRDEPDVPDVPIIHYALGGYGVWGDMREGDPAVIVACDGPVRPFYETGAAVTPIIGQGHDWGSAVAFPGGRVSATDQPTPPPNVAGEFLVGAADGSAAVVFRGAGLPTPTEAGTVVVQAAAPAAAVRLGGDDANLGVGRFGDAVAPDATWTAFATAVAGFINGLVPGTVVVPSAVKVGVISEASTIVVSK